jgi:hypothetical protein
MYQQKCATWSCNRTQFGEEQCTALEASCNEANNSLWTGCPRLTNQTHPDSRQLNCSTATCSCQDVGTCLEGRAAWSPQNCFPSDLSGLSCRFAGQTQSSCAKTITAYETVCSAVAPAGGWIMQMENLDRYTNKSEETYKIFGNNRSRPWTRNSTADPDAYFEATKGSDWSMWSATLLANSVKLGAPGEPAVAFGPSLPGSPVGAQLRPGQSELQWDARFGYTGAGTFTTPWKICF